MKVCYFFWNEETNHCDKSSCFMLLVLSMIDSLGVDGCSLLDGLQYIFGCLCIKEDESLLLFLITERKTNPVLKISCLTPILFSMPQPQGPTTLRKPACINECYLGKRRGRARTLIWKAYRRTGIF